MLNILAWRLTTRSPIALLYLSFPDLSGRLGSRYTQGSNTAQLPLGAGHASTPVGVCTMYAFEGKFSSVIDRSIDRLAASGSYKLAVAQKLSPSVEVGLQMSRGLCTTSTFQSNAMYQL